MLFYNDIPAANGSSETLVILHGLFGTGDNWITLARHWSQHYRIILPDARNHGHAFRWSELAFKTGLGDFTGLRKEQWDHS